MQPFGYARAQDLRHALELVGAGTAVLAGGTELVNLLRIGAEQPGRMLDIGDLDELAGITELPGGGLRIGANVTLADLADDPRVAAGWPVLQEAVLRSASPQVRNRATLGGNLRQRPRCPYFRLEGEAVPCNLRTAGSGCSALAAPGAWHAVAGWSEACVATQPSDPAVALVALGARVLLAGPGGERSVPAADFHLLPGEAAGPLDVVAEDELLVAVELPVPAPRSAYVKVRGRASFEFATVSAAVAVTCDGDEALSTVRIALGGLARAPWRLPAAEAALRGHRPRDTAAAGVVDRALAATRPFASNAFKVPLARAAVLRALREVSPA